MQTSVIIARFQTDILTEGHWHLITKAIEEGDHLVVVLGESPTRFTNIYPLPFEVRRDMLDKEFKKYSFAFKWDILKIIDYGDDDIWSNKLDELLKDYENVTLWGGRDSFIVTYVGKYPVKEVSQIKDVSASARRAKLAKYSISRNSAAFRRGIIFATENKFPTAYGTVDIAVLRYNSLDYKTQVILGKKLNSNTWCFPGGFVDVSDKSLEEAAHRELSEEVPGIKYKNLMYIASRKNYNWRYEGTQDGIMTSFFTTFWVSGEIIAGDDLEEVQWFTIKDIDINIISEEHQPLFKILKSRYLYE